MGFEVSTPAQVQRGSAFDLMHVKVGRDGQGFGFNRKTSHLNAFLLDLQRAF